MYLNQISADTSDPFVYQSRKMIAILRENEFNTEVLYKEFVH